MVLLAIQQVMCVPSLRMGIIMQIAIKKIMRMGIINVSVLIVVKSSPPMNLT